MCKILNFADFADFFRRLFRLHKILCNFAGFYEKMTMKSKIERYVVAAVAATLGLSASAQTKSEFRDSVQIDEVEVVAHSAQQRRNNVQIGAETIDVEELTKMPSLFGEKDLIRSLQLLPGVKSESDISTGYQVRGGTSSQNLVFFDEAPVYNVGHAMGLFSPFNEDVIQSGTLYKGLIPPRLGGATSSILDVNGREGSHDRFQGHFGIGLLLARGEIEAPLGKDKGSFLVAARRSYIDLFFKPIKKYRNNDLNFYDINARLDYRPNAQNRLTLSLFTGRDNIGVEDLLGMKWGNKNATLRWMYSSKHDVYSTLSLIYSNFDTDMSYDGAGMSQAFKGFIRQGGLKENIHIDRPHHRWDIGVQSLLIDLKSGEQTIQAEYYAREKRRGWTNDAWIGDVWSPRESLSISFGLRANLFSVLGGSPYYDIDADGNITKVYDYGSKEFVKTYFNLEPRVSMNWLMNEQWSMKLGYSRTAQHIQAVRSQAVSTPIDRYTFTSNIFKPLLADQVSLGFFWLKDDKTYDASAEIYYKDLKNVLDYKDGLDATSQIEMERILLAGKGRAYGLELMARKNAGRLQGWLSYTLSWSKNKIEGINDNEWYTAGNDRRHDITLVGIFKLNKRWTLTGTWNFNTGQALTAPNSMYKLMDGTTFFYYNERNSYRMPAYHRLDLSAAYTKKMKKTTQSWSFDIFNVYNHFNPFMVIFEQDDTRSNGIKATQYSLLGIVPSVSFSLNF